MKQGWKFVLYASLIIAGSILIFLLVSTVFLKNTGFEGKSLWDWMELLIIPAVLAGGAILINRSERALERKTAEYRAKLERELATDRQQEVALQAYLDRMGELLLEKKLRTANNKEVRNVARTRTLTVLRGLDKVRKGLVVKFLYEAGLISGKEPIINLSGANLSGTDLSATNLSGIDLSGAFLWDANLSGANLSGANLSGANLNEADLEFAYLSGANLRGAQLDGAKLWGVNLDGAAVTDEQFDHVKSFKHVIMPDGTKRE